MVDSNYNNTEVLADLPEEQTSQSSVKNFAARSKAEAKPQKREPVELPSTIPMNERKWIDIEPEESSLSLCVRVLEESNQYSSTMSNGTTRRRRSSSILENQVFIFGINFHKSIIGRMIVGKYAWQQEEDQKEGISTALIFQEQLFISELFKDIQDAISLILHYRTM